MDPVAQTKRWWQARTGEEETPLDGDTPAWMVSLGIHLCLLLALAGTITPAPEPVVPALTILQPSDSEELDFEKPKEIAIADEVAKTPGAKSEQSVEVAQAAAAVVDDKSEVTPDAVEVADSDIKVELIEDLVSTGLEFNQDFQVQGDVGVGTAGASGAVDRLTAEIAASLGKRSTIVCWVFDQSVSLVGQRQVIAERLERVFDELDGGGGLPGSSQLLNMVFAYGAKVAPVIDSPSDDTSAVVKAIESIPIDDSGVENTFEAIKTAASRANGKRLGQQSRNIMVIAFTDEVGNDKKRADEVAAFCRKNGVRVYVVGVPAPFGMPQVEMKFVEFDPNYEAGTEQWAVVDQGPETLLPEAVRVQSGRRTDEPIDSGFGPFSLSKLCAQTGGIYFAVHPNRGASGRVSDKQTAPMASRLRRFFDPEVMRQYRPDYLPEAKILEQVAKNKAKQALVDAAKKTPITPLESPRMEFLREDEGKLVLLFSEAQRAAAVLQPQIDAVYSILAAGQSDRENITEKRWQAGYDLAMGRVLAVKVRADAYNLMLAQAKSGMKFKKPDSNTWVLEPHEDVKNVGSPTQKLAELARMYLEQVIRLHPGTPWAMIAAEELAIPLGYAWKESRTDVAKEQMKPGNGGGDVVPEPTDPPKRPQLPPPKIRELKNI